MIILASASPRRKELLSRIVDGFKVIPCSGEEKTSYKRPHLYVMSLAEHKAREIASKKGKDNIVVAADTIVCYNGRILNKPADREEAKRFLRMLSGKTHAVYTGVCVIFADGKKEIYYCKSLVQFNNLDEDFIESYVAGGSPMDKAGGYGVQDNGVVRRVIGDYDNVVGLPLEKLSAILGEQDGNGRTYNRRGE